MRQTKSLQMLFLYVKLYWNMATLTAYQLSMESMMELTAGHQAENTA